MQSKIIGTELPSRHFQPRVYGVGAWTDHLHFGYDLVALLQPKLVVELGVDRGESYFAFCQAVAETKLAARCFAVDTWRGDEHAGDYDPTLTKIGKPVTPERLRNVSSYVLALAEALEGT